MDILANSTDQSVSFAAFTTATGAAVTITASTAGLSLWYRRGGVGAKTPISPSNLATLETAHTDGGILVIEGQEHRLDLPDAAVAAGVSSIEWGGSATGITIDGGQANLIGQTGTGSTLTTGDIDARLAAYDPPTNAQMEARTLAAASYGTAANQATILAAVMASGGTGANAVTITVTDGTNPLESAKVRVTKGAESYLVSTNASGVASFSLDNGTWTVAVTLFGYDYIDATPTVVVAGSATKTCVMTQNVPTASEPGTVTGYLYCYNAGVAQSGVTVTLHQTEPGSATGEASDSTKRTAVSNALGYAEFTGLFPGASYTVRRGSGPTRNVTIAAGATGSVELTSVMGT